MTIGRRTFLAAGGACWVSGCRPAEVAAPEVVAPPTPAAPDRLRGHVEVRSGPVGAYVSDPWTFSTVSYWIEGPTGSVLIDTQFLQTSALHFVQQAHKTSGRPATTAIVLHANPDKFNGTATLQGERIDVVTSEPVLAAIPRVHAQRRAAFGPRYAPEYPTAEPAPRSLGVDTTTIAGGGIEVVAHVHGAGCSAAHVVVEHDGHVFVGDLIGAGVHAWLELGLVDPWRERLDALAAMAPTHVHPGRGPSGGAELIDAQRRYLDNVVDIVRAQGASGRPDPNAIAAAKQAVVRAYPDYGFSGFLDHGLPAVWRTLADPGRPEADVARDALRKPQAIMDLFEIGRGDRVVELMAGSGYYIELLARRVGPTGRVWAHNTPFVLDRFARGPITERLESPALEFVERLDTELADPQLPQELDAVLMVLFFHDLYWQEVDRAAMMRAVFAALRPGGVFGLIDHAAAPGHGALDVKTLHRIEESVVVAELSAAGFVLEQRSDLLRNPEDQHDTKFDRGERRDRTDRFVLKFRKPG